MDRQIVGICASMLHEYCPSSATDSVSRPSKNYKTPVSVSEEDLRFLRRVVRHMGLYVRKGLKSVDSTFSRSGSKVELRTQGVDRAGRNDLYVLLLSTSFARALKDVL